MGRARQFAKGLSGSTVGWFRRIAPYRRGSSLSTASTRRIHHQRRLGNQRGKFDFPIEGFPASLADGVAVVADLGSILSDNVVCEERHLTFAVWIGADSRFNPEGIDDISGDTVGDFCLYRLNKVSFNGRPSFQTTGRAASRSKAAFNASNSTGSVSVFTMNHANGIEINTDHAATQAQGFDNSRTATHERIKNELVLRVRIVGVILVELRYDVGRSAIGPEGWLSVPRRIARNTHEARRANHLCI